MHCCCPEAWRSASSPAPCLPHPAPLPRRRAPARPSGLPAGSPPPGWHCPGPQSAGAPQTRARASAGTPAPQRESPAVGSKRRRRRAGRAGLRRQQSTRRQLPSITRWLRSAGWATSACATAGCHTRTGLTFSPPSRER